MVREKKRKASTEDPAPAVRKAKKGTVIPQSPEESSDDVPVEKPRSTRAPPWPKPKKTTAKAPARSISEDEDSDKGEGPSNPPPCVCSVQLRIGTDDPN